MKYDKLRDNLIEIFNSMGSSYKMYDADGSPMSNPYKSRYFFIDNPNIMFIVDEETNTLEMHRSNFSMDEFKRLLKMFRNVTRKYFVRLRVSTYNNAITPKTFSRDVMRRKTNKIIALGEKVNVSLDSPESRVIFEDIVTESYISGHLDDNMYTSVVALLESGSEVDTGKLNYFLSLLLAKLRE